MVCSNDGFPDEKSETISFYRFCDLVLAAPLSTSPVGGGPSASHQQPVLAKLQLTFSYLRQTMRSIYSPHELLKAARPPWFESGRQQVLTIKKTL